MRLYVLRAENCTGTFEPLKPILAESPGEATCKAVKSDTSGAFTNLNGFDLHVLLASPAVVAAYLSGFVASSLDQDAMSQEAKDVILGLLAQIVGGADHA